jgi:nucleoside-diphosphate-sugar epimerase
LKPYHGMKTLIHRFYDSIQNHEEMPVTPQQALQVIETMDEIWKQLQPRPLRFDRVVPQADPAAKPGPRVLVTGGTGFLGGHTVEGLLGAGYRVRVLARKLSNTERLRKLPVEIFYGDVADRKSLAEAFAGVELAVHAAAGTSGKKSDCDSATLQGTRNVLEFCRQNRVRKLVYISSCSVYGVADYSTSQAVTEESPLERFPFRRGEYSASKQRAEELVRTAMGCGKFPVTVLRPGTIYGPGGDLYSPMIGLSLFNKLFVVFGPGSFVLPYVYIDNLVHAIVRCLESEQADNQIFNVVDDHGITKRQYMQKIVKPAHPGARILYLPAGLLSAATGLQEALFGLLKRTPVLTRYRLLSSQRNVRYDSSKITTLLQWSPAVAFEEAAVRTVRSHLPQQAPFAEASGDIAPEFKPNEPNGTSAKTPTSS